MTVMMKKETTPQPSHQARAASSRRIPESMAMSQANSRQRDAAEISPQRMAWKAKLASPVAVRVAAHRGCSGLTLAAHSGAETRESNPKARAKPPAKAKGRAGPRSATVSCGSVPSRLCRAVVTPRAVSCMRPSIRPVRAKNSPQKTMKST